MFLYTWRKVTEDERYTIVSDYLGTPFQAYDSRGELVWDIGKSKSPEAFERRKSKHNTNLRKAVGKSGDSSIRYDFEVIEQNIVGAENLSFREETNIRKYGGLKKDGGVLENKIHAMNESKYFNLGGNLDKLGNKIPCK